jgi:pimeloyl-ACP methyl ester carboxylesterase
MFDVCNPSAIADNIRESAIEAALVPRLLLNEHFVVDGLDACGLGGIKFDENRLGLMGHSMGATIAPLVLALEPRFRSIVMSGANVSYIENFPTKEQPFQLASTLEQMLSLKYCLDEFELLPSLFEWAEEQSDPAVYEPIVVGRRPVPDVLMIQGIGDHYVPSPVANASSLGLELDVAGPTYDGRDPHLCPNSKDDVPIMMCGGARRYPISPVVPLLKTVLGRKQIDPIPKGGVANNRPGATGGVAQYERDRLCRQDGHEVAYQIAKARWQYRCFLKSFAQGQARISAPPPGDPADDSKEIDADCPR